MEADPAAWISELRGSHERLAELVGKLDSEDLRRPSYDDDWTVAQVLSHIGSGAEISELRLAAAANGSAPPAREDFPKIWRRWDSLSPEAVAAAVVDADRSCVRRFERLDERTGRDLRIPFMPGLDLDILGAVGMRLNEHALHSWDVAVTFDPAARVAPGPVALLLDLLVERLDWLVARIVPREASDAVAAKLGGREILVRTTDPERWLAIALGGDSTRLLAGDPDGDPRLVVPAEAFLRLFSGRLDPDHTPDGVQVTPPLTLADLRTLFPGY